uniref:Uncharacterized protein n=1 Tax=Globisporangium ultimum (strain ATCC 200006 / CBS 805.95 / DAOM BR144) TaxID=431595 RepID=K3WD68_GLOUD
ADACSSIQHARELSAGKCDQVDLHDKKAYFAVINSGMDVLDKTGVLRKQLAAIDPFSVHNLTLAPAVVSFLGTQFEVATYIHTAHVAGISALRPRRFNVTSASTFAMGGDFGGELATNGTMHLMIKQLYRKWWQPCWTRPWNLWRCKPAQMDVDMQLGWIRPQASISVRMLMLQCPRKTTERTGQNNNRVTESQSKCKDLTIADFVSAMLHRDLKELQTRILRRTKQLGTRSVDVAFERFSRFEIHFHGSNRFTRAVTDALAHFSQRQVDQRGAMYRAIVAFAETYLNAIMNDAIEREISDQFGATCYDLIRSDRCGQVTRLT